MKVAANGGGRVADLSIGPPAPPEVRTEPGGGPELVEELVDVESLPQVDESVVEGLLRGMGGALGYAIGDQDVPEHWRFTDQEIRDLTPPLTRVVNRNAHLRRAVIRGDEMAIGLVLAGYAGRNVALANQARERRQRELNREAGPAEGDVRTDDPGAAGPAGGSWGDGRGVPGPAGGGLR